MRHSILSAALTALCFAPVCHAQATLPATQPATTAPVAATQPAATQPLAAPLPSADSFLPRLGSDSWHTRQAAVDDLVRLGEDARPIIQELLARQLNDAEVRTRLEAAQAQIDENRLIGPSLITMHLRDAAPGAVFAELSKQCYATLRPFPDNLFDTPNLPRVSLDIDHQPFWKAMGQIAEKTGIDIQQYNEGVRLMRGGFRMNSPYAAVEGAFLVVPTQITRTQTVMLAGGGSSNDFSMQIMVYSEPKLHVLNSSSAVKLDEVADDAGNSLIPTSETNRGYYGGAGGCWNMVAELKYPEHPGSKIAKFRGGGTFTIQTKSQRTQIPDIKNLKEVARVIGDIPVVFHELKKNGPNWELHFSANPQAFGNNRWFQFQQSVQTQLQLLDDRGEPLDHRGMGSAGNNNGMEFTVTFGTSMRPDGNHTSEPAKLIWEVPTASKEVRVPLDFKDLQMPK